MFSLQLYLHFPLLAPPAVACIGEGWRREGDSNPRSRKRDNRFRGDRIRPLCHLSQGKQKNSHKGDLETILTVFCFYDYTEMILCYRGRRGGSF
jgi:hypothetical protein